MGVRLYAVLICAAAFLLLSGPLAAQNDYKLLILSPRVGYIIDAEERVRFRLFSSIKDFQSALIVQMPDSSVRVHFKILLPSGKTRDTLVIYSMPLLCNISEKIDHFEDLEKGLYIAGTQRPALLPGVTIRPDSLVPGRDDALAGFLRTGIKAVEPLPDAENMDAVDEILPLSTDTDLKIKSSGPDFQLFAGISSFNADLSSLDGFIGPAAEKGEEYYRVPLLPRPKANLRMNASINFGIKLRVSDNFEIEGELGQASDYFDGSKYTGDLHLYILSSSVYYNLNFLQKKYIKPYAAVGISWTNFDIHLTVPASMPLRDDQMLAGYQMTGSESMLGWNMSAGAAILPAENTPLYFSLFARYLRVPAITLRNNSYHELKERAKLDFTNLYFGLNLILDTGRF